jgi:hypothetical protein
LVRSQYLTLSSQGSLLTATILTKVLDKSRTGPIANLVRSVEAIQSSLRMLAYRLPTLIRFWLGLPARNRPALSCRPTPPMDSQQAFRAFLVKPAIQQPLLTPQDSIRDAHGGFYSGGAKSYDAENRGSRSAAHVVPKSSTLVAFGVRALLCNLLSNRIPDKNIRLILAIP